MRLLKVLPFIRQSPTTRLQSKQVVTMILNMILLIYFIESKDMTRLLRLLTMLMNCSEIQVS